MTGTLTGPYQGTEPFVLTTEYALALNEVSFQEDNSPALAWYREDCAVHLPGRPVLDAQGFLDVITMVRTAKPDLVLEMKNIFVDGNTAVIHAVFSGHQNGPLLGIPPTGTYVRIEEFGTVTFDERGRVSEFRQEADYLGMLTTIGVVPPLGLGPIGQIAHSVRTAVRLSKLDREHRRGRA